MSSKLPYFYYCISQPCHTHKHYVSPSCSTYKANLKFACTHNGSRDGCEGGITCDFKPHRNIRGFSGNDAHHMRHRVTFHDRKSEGGLLKKQGSCIGRHFRFGNPLDMKTTCWGFLRTSIVDSFNLRGKQRIKDWVTQCYATFCCKWVSLLVSLVDPRPQTLQR